MINTTMTHGLVLLENRCRRMRAMVVRTARVVHMVLPPRDLLPLGEMIVHSTQTSPIEKA